MAGSLDDMQRLFMRAMSSITEDAMRIIEVEGLNFIKKNFRDQGFHGESFEKWQERKKTDSRGRDKTRYRTNRRGNIGELTKFGRKEQGRAILTGHRSGGDKLRNSLRARRQGLKNIFYTYKAYAETHNEGTDKIPQRQFMGNSPVLNKKIADKIKRTLDRQFKR